MTVGCSGGRRARVLLSETGFFFLPEGVCLYNIQKESLDEGAGLLDDMRGLSLGEPCRHRTPVPGQEAGGHRGKEWKPRDVRYRQAVQGKTIISAIRESW